MEEYVWRPSGIRLKESVVIIKPLVAFKHFVMPGLNDVNWIEDGKIITDTGMRKREWAGLILHSICLSDLTDREIDIAKDKIGGDGVIVTNENGNYYGCYIEQTLVTHRSIKHSGVTDGIRERLMDKSSKGESYTDNKHLVIMINQNGEIMPENIARIVSEGGYNIVNVIGYESTTRHYLCYLFDRENVNEPIHKCAIRESALIEQALAI